MSINDRYLLTAGISIGGLITLAIYHWAGDSAEVISIAITSITAIYASTLSDDVSTNQFETVEED